MVLVHSYFERTCRLVVVKEFAEDTASRIPSSVCMTVSNPCIILK